MRTFLGKMAAKWSWCVALALLANEEMEYERENEVVEGEKVARRWWTRPWILERHLNTSNTIFKLSKDLILVSTRTGNMYAL